MAARNTEVSRAADRFADARHVEQVVGGRAARQEVDDARENLRTVVQQTRKR